MKRFHLFSDNPKSPSKYRLTVNSKQLLIVTIALLLCGSKVSAHDFEVNGIYYKITTYSTDLTVTVTHKGSLLDNHSNDYKGEVSIPATTTFDNKTYSVTSIGDYAFANCSSLTSITIPKSVTSIGASAFSGCSSLSSVNIPSAVTTIGNNAFYGCSSLVTIDIPTSVSFVGDKAFSGTQIVFPEENGIRYIGAIAHTLTDRTLTEYKLKEGTVTIAAGLFKNCTNLQSVHIPNSVDSIGFQAFYGCI